MWFKTFWGESQITFDDLKFQDFALYFFYSYCVFMHFAIFMNILFGLDFLVLQVSTFFLNHQK